MPPQAPQTNPTDPSGVSSIPSSTREKILGGIGGFLSGGSGQEFKGSQLDEAIQTHYQRRLDEARMHRKNAATYAGIIATGINPQTGAPLTDEEKKQYQNWYDSSIGAFEKIAGVSKETKGAVAKAKNIVEHIIGMGKQRQAQGQPGGGGLPPPPGGAPAAAAPAANGTPAVGAGGKAETLPAAPANKPGLPPPPSMQQSLAAPALQQQADDQRALAFEKQHAKDVAEVNTKAQAESFGDMFKGFLKGFEEAFGRKPTKEEVDTYFKMAPPPKLITKVEPDKDSPTGYAYVSYDQISGTEYTRQMGAVPPRGLIPTETDTSTTDPYGQTTHTHTQRKPVLGGGTGASASGGKGNGAAGAEGVQTPAGAPRSNKGLTTPPGKSAAPGAASQPGTSSPLDGNGHIPQGAGLQPVVEAANELLDGRDLKDIQPAKLKAPAAKLARSYGWEQGKFTPKEQVMLRENSTFLNAALSDASLSVLDRGTISRSALGQVAADADKMGMIGRGVTTAISGQLDEQQLSFLRIYRRLVGVVSGISQLVRSGRATEATVNRLKAELPNPTNTPSSADAKERIKMLMQEIKVALEKGQFTDADSAGGKGKRLPDNPPPGSSSKVDEILRKHGVTD